MQKIDLEDQFRQYLLKVFQHPEQLPDAQYAEVKKAFFGAAGQITLEIIERVQKQKGISGKILSDMANQVNTFWQGEINKLEKDSAEKLLEVIQTNNKPVNSGSEHN